MTPVLRTVMVGTGAIAGAHAAAVAAHRDRAAVVHAVDLDAAAAERFAEQHGIAAWGTDLAAALAGDGAGPPDLAHICTPPGSHVALAVQCLEAGVPVLLEKPPALSLAEVDRLLEASERTGVDVAVVLQHRFGAGAGRTRALLAEGGVGRPLVAACHTLWYRDADYFAVPWRGRWDVEGGGPTMGHGIHQIDLLLALLGPWDEVSAMAGRQARDTETEDVSTALVRFADGTLATVVNSLVSPRQTSSIRIDTEHATVELDHLYGYTDANWTFTPAPGHEHLAERWVPDADAPASSHTGQLGALLDVLAAQRGAGRPDGDDEAGAAGLPVPLRTARDTLELVAAVYASAFTGRTVRRGDIGPGHPFYARMDGTGPPWTTREGSTA